MHWKGFAMSVLESILNINPERIAVTEIFGAIGSPQRTAEFGRMMKAIEENKRVRALVVDIDSPGGGAGASEFMHNAIARVAKKKPVVAAVRGMGASGAYMAACGATRIIAVPMALVGSIGVISMRPMLYDALDRIGVRVNVTKSGRLKDMFSSFREPTPEEEQKEQALMDAVYDRFVTMVAEARSLDAAKAREVATGEVFTAAQAQELGLIDGLGDLDEAIDQARSLAGMTDRKVMYVRPHRSLRDRLLGNVSAATVDAFANALETRLRERQIYLG
jgi:protease-4